MSTGPVAIVGIGCKLPGNVSNTGELLTVFLEGVDCIQEIPPERWDADLFYDPDPLRPGKTYVRHGGFISDFDCFDAAFFGITSAEAECMDPQQRLLLQTIWHAIESSGTNPEELSGARTGVFLASLNTNNYTQVKDRVRGPSGISAYDAVGDAMSISAGRIAHFFNFGGPCFTLDTACSGGLVALHLARQSLLTGECDTAIVAGVNLILTPDVHIAFSKMSLLSPSGRCMVFDSRADGYVRSEGCVVLVLRRESEALDRGDSIMASIMGSAINHDGRTPALTAPNGKAQVKVMRQALDRTEADPAQIGYVEAHGTGTLVGDPIEMQAISEVYGRSRDGQQLYIGSAKSNFGHIEAGAGLLGVAKAALSLDRETIFPSLHFKHPNPKFDLQEGAIQVPISPVAWPAGDKPRLTAVNAFGYSGTNAHVILREAPPAAGNPVRRPRPFELLALSAKSSESLAELAERWEGFLSQAEPGVLPDAAFSAATGRAGLRHRLAVIGSSADDVAQSLGRWRDGGSPASVCEGQAHSSRNIAFVFTGQGSQYAGMGRQLYETEPVFAAAVDQCSELMEPELDVPLRTILFEDRAADEIDDTRYAQPALFAVEYALAMLLQAWGIKPDIVIGHSIGEIVAACISGILPIEDATHFSVSRGRLMSELPRNGRMLAVAVTEETAREWLVGREGAVAIAAVNGPRSVVVSGTAEAVDEIAGLAEEAGARTSELHVSHAFHSPLMDPILTEIEKIADGFPAHRAAIPIVSNLTGDLMTGDEGPEYWSRHTRSPVRFYDGMRTLMATGCQTIIEIGPHPALSPVISGAFGSTDTQLIATLRRNGEDTKNMLTAAGTLWVSGNPVTLAGLFADRCLRRVQVPLYPFQRTRHWVSSAASGAGGRASGPPPQAPRRVQPLPGYESPNGHELPAFEATLSAAAPWTDHRVLDMTVFPASGYLEMVTRACAAVHHNLQNSNARDGAAGPTVLSEVAFARPLILKADKPVNVVATLRQAGPDVPGRLTFTIATDNGERPTVHCRGLIGAEDIADGGHPRIRDIRDEITVSMAPGLLYGDLRRTGLEYGASFSTVRELWVGEADQGEALGRVSNVPDGGSAEPHPFRLSTLLDGSLHVVGAALGTLSSKIEEGVYIPASLRRLVMYSSFPAQVWCYAKVRINENGSAAVANIRIIDGNDGLLAVIEDIELRHTASLAVDGDSKYSSQPVQRQVRSRRKEFTDRLESLAHEERLAIITSWLTEEVWETLGPVAEELGLEGHDLDPSAALLEIGLDSLMITELQRRIQETLDFRFEVMEGLDYQSIDHLAHYIHDNVLTLAPADTKSGV